MKFVFPYYVALDMLIITVYFYEEFRVYCLMFLSFYDSLFYSIFFQNIFQQIEVKEKNHSVTFYTLLAFY
jgi:hypothetical protein